MTKTRQRIFVGLSGGVDSAVSAALLLQAGHDVVGVFIKVWQADFLPCTWRNERREAMRAAAHLGIPFRTLDLEKEYKQEVVDSMIREYGAGRVPNPDVMCNKHVKFGAFLDYARKEGADAVATGHYARILDRDGAPALFAGVDQEKDQSYFLWTLRADDLPAIRFPVGHLEKQAVRALASSFGLPNAAKKDSQGLCFMGPVDMAEFLAHYLPVVPGDVIDENGAVIGTHQGAALYAIGQRRGFATKKVSSHEAPYVVVAKDMNANTITVAHQVTPPSDRTHQEIVVSDLNLIDSRGFPDVPSLHARVRYRGPLLPVSVTSWDKDSRAANVFCDLEFEGVSAGQSLVFYEGEVCIGGGIIAGISV